MLRQGHTLLRFAKHHRQVCHPTSDMTGCPVATGPTSPTELHLTPLTRSMGSRSISPSVSPGRHADDVGHDASCGAVGPWRAAAPAGRPRRQASHRDHDGGAGARAQRSGAVWVLSCVVRCGAGRGWAVLDWTRLGAPSMAGRDALHLVPPRSHCNGNQGIESDIGRN
jgi:hypothetical protein